MLATEYNRYTPKISRSGQRLGIERLLPHGQLNDVPTQRLAVLQFRRRQGTQRLRRLQLRPGVDCRRTVERRATAVLTSSVGTPAMSSTADVSTSPGTVVSAISGGF